jgi:hypothetical protein
VTPEISKAKKIDFFRRRVTQSGISDQRHMDQLIADYIITEAWPINTVARQSFRNLLQGSNPNVQVMGRKKLTKLIVDEYVGFSKEIRRQLASVEYVALRADIWSSRNRSFMVVTLHWLDEHLKRQSVGLACKRFRGIFLLRN